jgi:phosphoribosyl-AMP cyclohydrolase
VDFDKLGGLIPAVVQDDESGDVLMVGFMNQAALERTVASGYATFYSRSRERLWTKGETSGNRLRVKQLLVDCDRDTLLVKAVTEGDGKVCHTGERTCFFQPLTEQESRP